ncbi:MAG: methylmalonyl Co-A mutase-associated GTPase MeaB [Firmicutes bacterium]|nr:methylmalonyl Co-A mutase-associated GTPase MeaB [Bacillota bacterium]
MVELTKKVMEGDVRSASRLIRNLEDGSADAKQVIKRIFPYTGKAHIVGLTGSPGAGKSTLTDELIACYRKTEKSIGVLAIDPTSPFTGGAILGDRIRMQRHAEDPNVFVRSLATRGAMGGLSKAVGDAVHVMDVMGKDMIIIETVGTGQQEVEIINHAHTVIVVLVPGMGDEIQAIKAGIMEIGDIFVINKADRDGAGKLYKEVMSMLDMAPSFPGGWRPPILLAETVFEPPKFSKEVEKIAEAIDAHYKHLIENNILGDRVRRKALHEMNEALKQAILEPVLNKLIADGDFDRMVEQLMTKESDPYTLADQVGNKYLDKCIRE